MNQGSRSAALPRIHSAGLLARLVILGVLFFAEKIVLNGFVDFDRAQTATGFGAALRIGQHWVFRFFVAFAAAAALFAVARGGPALTAAAADFRAAKVRLDWLFGHLLLVMVLAPLSFALYRYVISDLDLAGLTAVWLLVGIGAVAAAALAFGTVAVWATLARALSAVWMYAAVAAVLGTAAMQALQSLWQPTAMLTFNLVRWLLHPLLPTLNADPVSRLLSTDRFAVQIADVCSGLEGVGLIVAFSSAWLLYFRREYFFPRALWLIPAGVAAIFLLNVVRIAVLILIGDAGYPDVAVYGFHSQAGWIAFIGVSCGLVFISRRSAWLNRAAMGTTAAHSRDNPTATYLMPLLAILAAGVLARAMSGGFDSLYALRWVAGLGVIAIYRRQLAAIDWRFSWRGPAVGIGVFLVWIALARALTPHTAMPPALSGSSPVLRAVWIASRCSAAILLVPIAEELAYRGYLMRRLMSADFERVPYASVHVGAVAAAAIAFGLAHGVLWLPGVAAGTAFGILAVRRGSLGEAVAAHITANTLVAVAVLGFGQWQLW